MVKSELQKLWSNVSHVIYRGLHRAPIFHLRDLPLSEESQRLILVRDMTTRRLQESLRADYDKEKERILAERK